MTDTERLTDMIQDAVGGCARHWARLIAEHLIEQGVTLPPAKEVKMNWEDDDDD